MIHFDNDYMSGATHEIIKQLTLTNMEKTVGYGLDDYTAKAIKLILDACNLQNKGYVHFMTGGTQTNATVIDALLQNWQGVIATEDAHINVHESGAIETGGHKVLVIPSKDGKLAAADIDSYVTDFYKDDTWQHKVEPGMVYISFPTELGTLYSLDELKAIHNICQKHDIPLYIDGARLGYGLAASGITLPEFASACDVFYIGGTKVGALFGEAVVTSNPSLLPHFMTQVKQHGGLLAKGRLLGIQFATLFTDDLYMRISRHAITMAQRLKKAFVSNGYKMFIDSPTNQQFFILPNEVMDEMRKHFSFEIWGVKGQSETAVRFVTSWATTEKEIEELEEFLDKHNTQHRR